MVVRRRAARPDFEMVEQAESALHLRVHALNAMRAGFEKTAAGFLKRALAAEQRVPSALLKSLREKHPNWAPGLETAGNITDLRTLAKQRNQGGRN